MVAGKPERPLFDETIARTGARRPLMVGDRLDTDIEGATHAGIDSLLVMTGVTGLPDLVAAAPRLRPTYLAADLRGLLAPHAAPTVDGQAWAAGGWTATVADGRLTTAGTGDPSDWWRCVAAAAWSALDDRGPSVDVSGVRPPEAATGDGYAPRMSETGAEQTGVPAVDEALDGCSRASRSGRSTSTPPCSSPSTERCVRAERRPGRLTGPDRCHPVACAWTRSWSVADSPAPGSTPAS